MRCSVRSMCSSRRTDARFLLTACSLRRSSLTSRRTAHMEAVQPSASRTGSPVMCRVRVRPSGRTMRNSPSIGLAVDEAARHHGGQHGLVLGQQHGRQVVEGERCGPGRPAEDLVQLLGPAGLVGEEVPLGAAHPVQQGTGPRAVRGPGSKGASSAHRSGRPARSWPRCWSRLSRCCTASSHRARCQRSWGSSSSNTTASRRTASTSPRSRRVRWIRASTASCAGSCGAGRSAKRGTASRTPIQARPSRF